MELSPTQKQHLESLLRKGDELAAVRYLQHNLNLSAEEALSLTEKLDKTVEEYSPQDLKGAIKKAKLNTFKNNKTGKIIGGVFLFFGVAMLSGSIYLGYSDFSFAQTAIPVRGEVIDLSTSYSTDDDGNRTLMYSGVFEYEFNNTTYTHESSVSSSSPDYEIGEVVEILVDPNSPAKALVNNFWERWFASILLGFLGLVFSGAGFLVFKLG